MVQGVLGEPRARWIVDDSALSKCRGLHAALHTLDEVDVFDL